MCSERLRVNRDLSVVEKLDGYRRLLEEYDRKIRELTALHGDSYPTQLTEDRKNLLALIQKTEADPRKKYQDVKGSE